MKRVKWLVIVATLAVTGLTAVAAQAGWLQFLFGASSSYTKTRYPIVLVHGLLGFRSVIGALDYWYRIPEELARGGAKVYVVEVAPVNSNEVRGEQLLRQVEEIIAASGAAKVNLIGHSQGAPTARYVAGVRPDLVASVSTVGGVNRGSAVADLLATLPPGSAGLAADVANAFGNLIDLLSDGRDNYREDAFAALNSLTTAGMADFNRRFPGGVPATACGSGAAVANGVRYYSWSGTSVFTNLLDLSDPLLAVTSAAFRGAANDGLVGRCSSHLGVVIRDDYDMNHLDEVNQLLGLDALFTDPVAIYRAHANRLKNAGV